MVVVSVVEANLVDVSAGSLVDELLKLKLELEGSDKTSTAEETNFILARGRERGSRRTKIENLGVAGRG